MTIRPHERPPHPSGPTIIPIESFRACWGVGGCGTAYFVTTGLRVTSTATEGRPSKSGR